MLLTAEWPKCEHMRNRLQRGNAVVYVKPKNPPGRPRKLPFEATRPELNVCIKGVCLAGVEAAASIQALFEECVRAGKCRPVEQLHNTSDTS